MYSIQTEKGLVEAGILNVLKAISKAKHVKGSFIVSEENGKVVWPLRLK
ncbi:hypothetical protein [Leptospira idonii]|nr:hypothetical protein [Leptospira idonii]